MTPKSKPKATREMLENVIRAMGISQTLDPVVLVGVEGYYKDTMGRPGVNDRGIYDDAFFWVSPDLFASYNGNVDPSTYRAGFGSGSSKGMAVLDYGVWRYRTGIHYGKIPHQAFRQAAPVNIHRDGGVIGKYRDRLDSSINIHRGGVNSTSSLGCQTVPPDQWDSFRSVGYAELKQYKVDDFPYIKISEAEFRKLAGKA